MSASSRDQTTEWPLAVEPEPVQPEPVSQKSKKKKKSPILLSRSSQNILQQSNPIIANHLQQKKEEIRASLIAPIIKKLAKYTEEQGPTAVFNSRIMGFINQKIAGLVEKGVGTIKKEFQDNWYHNQTAWGNGEYPREKEIQKDFLDILNKLEKLEVIFAGLIPALEADNQYQLKFDQFKNFPLENFTESCDQAVEKDIENEISRIRNRLNCLVDQNKKEIDAIKATIIQRWESLNASVIHYQQDIATFQAGVAAKIEMWNGAIQNLETKSITELSELKNKIAQDIQALASDWDKLKQASQRLLTSKQDFDKERIAAIDSIQQKQWLLPDIDIKIELGAFNTIFIETNKQKAALDKQSAIDELTKLNEKISGNIEFFDKNLDDLLLSLHEVTQDGKLINDLKPDKDKKKTSLTILSQSVIKKITLLEKQQEEVVKVFDQETILKKANQAISQAAHENHNQAGQTLEEYRKHAITQVPSAVDVPAISENMLQGLMSIKNSVEDAEQNERQREEAQRRVQEAVREAQEIAQEAVCKAQEVAQEAIRKAQEAAVRRIQEVAQEATARRIQEATQEAVRKTQEAAQRSVRVERPIENPQRIPEKKRNLFIRIVLVVVGFFKGLFSKKPKSEPAVQVVSAAVPPSAQQPVRAAAQTIPQTPAVVVSPAVPTFNRSPTLRTQSILSHPVDPNGLNRKQEQLAFILSCLRDEINQADGKAEVKVDEAFCNDVEKQLQALKPSPNFAEKLNGIEDQIKRKIGEPEYQEFYTKAEQDVAAARATRS